MRGIPVTSFRSHLYKHWRAATYAQSNLEDNGWACEPPEDRKDPAYSFSATKGGRTLLVFAHFRKLPPADRESQIVHASSRATLRLEEAAREVGAVPVMAHVVCLERLGETFTVMAPLDMYGEGNGVLMRGRNNRAVAKVDDRSLAFLRNHPRVMVSTVQMAVGSL